MIQPKDNTQVIAHIYIITPKNEGNQDGGRLAFIDLLSIWKFDLFQQRYFVQQLLDGIRCFLHKTSCSVKIGSIEKNLNISGSKTRQRLPAASFLNFSPHCPVSLFPRRKYLLDSLAPCSVHQSSLLLLEADWKTNILMHIKHLGVLLFLFLFVFLYLYCFYLFFWRGEEYWFNNLKPTLSRFSWQDSKDYHETIIDEIRTMQGGITSAH